MPKAVAQLRPYRIAIPVLLLLVLVAFELAQPPRTLLPPGTATGILLVRTLDGTFPRDPSVSVQGRWTAFDLNALTVQVGAVAGEVPLTDLDTTDADIVWHSTVIGRGHERTPSPDGQLAYITPSRRTVVVVDRGGVKRAYKMPRVRLIRALHWSPDERMILYCYPHSTLLFALNWRFTNTWGVAILDLASGKSYRVFPRTTPQGAIWGVGETRAIRWVIKPPPDP